MSIDCGWVMSRLSSASCGAVCISTLKPRSLVAWSAISLIAEYEPPTWTSFTSFMFWAQISGNPSIKPLPAAAALVTAAAFRNRRRPGAASCASGGVVAALSGLSSSCSFMVVPSFCGPCTAHVEIILFSMPG